MAAKTTKTITRIISRAGPRVIDFDSTKSEILPGQAVFHMDFHLSKSDFHTVRGGPALPSLRLSSGSAIFN